jgi:hypothetical protein
MYDAWSAYDDRAVGTELQGALRRPADERSLENKEKAVSYAAYRALVDLVPADRAVVYVPFMKQLGYDPGDRSTDIESPAGIGNVACAAVLEFRHHDQANQLGDLAQGAYSDWTHYVSANRPSRVPVRSSGGAWSQRSKRIHADDCGPVDESGRWAVRTVPGYSDSGNQKGPDEYRLRPGTCSWHWESRSWHGTLPVGQS